jgi:hypothetical protein
MAYPLKDIVDLSIRLDAFPVTRAGFGTPLFIGTTDPDPAPKVAVYTSLEAVAEVYADDEAEYLAAATYFGQNPRPAQLAIGYKSSEETYAEALTAIRAIYDDWFFVTMQSTSVADQTPVATAVSAIAGYRQAHFVSTNTDDVLDGAVTTDIGSVLKASSRLTCFAHYHQQSTSGTRSQYPELALLGKMAVSRETSQRIPGTLPATYQPVSGVTNSWFFGAPTPFSDADRAVLEAKRYTHYDDLSQLVRAFGCRSGANVPFDTVYFLGWLSARIPENVTETLTRAADRGEKVPFNDQGIAIIEAAVRDVFDTAVSADVVEEGYDLTLPTRAETTFADRVERLLNGATFSAKLTGAIEKVAISGALLA